jgi:hypothetical protein
MNRATTIRSAPCLPMCARVYWLQAPCSSLSAIGARDYRKPAGCAYGAVQIKAIEPALANRCWSVSMTRTLGALPRDWPGERDAVHA